MDTLCTIHSLLSLAEIWVLKLLLCLILRDLNMDGNRVSVEQRNRVEAAHSSCITTYSHVTKFSKSVD